MCTFKAIRCWLKTELTNKAPKNWDEKRKEINERILKLMRSPKQEATIEEIDIDETPENSDENENNKPSVTKNLGRLDIRSRDIDIAKVHDYNILKRCDNHDIQAWKSYPGIGEIIRISRNIIEKHDTKDID